MVANKVLVNAQARPMAQRWLHRPLGFWLVAILAGPLSAIAQPVPNPYDQTRTAAFRYHANGMLAQEIVEPGQADQCVVTSYAYDPQGNRVLTSVANCAGAPDAALFPTRGTRASFDAASATVGNTAVAIPAGTFAHTSKVAVSRDLASPTADPNTDAAAHTESRSFDPRFGAVRKLTGPNGLSTHWEHDDFGRVVKELRADGTQTITRYCYLPGRMPGYDAESAGVNSSGCPVAAPAEAPAAAVMFQHTESQSGANAKISPWSRAYFDAAGRQIRVATQSYDGPDQPARVVVQDTDYDAFGKAVVATQAYFLDSGSASTTGSGDVGLTRTDHDHLGRPVRVYAADPAKAGVGAPVQFGARGSRWATMTQLAYAALESTVTDDAGRTRTEVKSADGKVVQVTDALGSTVVHHHDAMGNLIETQDALLNVIKVFYDQRGRKIRMEDPDAGAVDYCYDALGQLKAQQNSKMREGHGTVTCPIPVSATASVSHAAPVVAGWTTLAYDRLGRMTERVEPEYTSTWYHDRDRAGNLCGKSIGKPCESRTSHGVVRKTFYDDLGRVSRSRTDITNGPSVATGISYDAATGRPDLQTYPSGLQVKSLYTANGALRALESVSTLKVAGVAANRTLWQLQVVDAAGRAERQLLGNGVRSTAEYEAQSGRLRYLRAGSEQQNHVVDQELRWNSLNQLTLRADAIGSGGSPAVAVTDGYEYDELGRLKRYTVGGNGNPAMRSVELQYNAVGMLLYKSDVGIYNYANKGVAWGQPHTLRSVSGGLHSASYSYDLNGNLTSATGGKYRSVSYTSFNLPDDSQGLQGPAGTPKYTWQYDENHQRVKELRVNAQGTRTTWYFHPDNRGGLGFEHEQPAAGPAQSRHFIGGVAVVVTEGALPGVQANGLPAAWGSEVAVAKLEYWHKDHLGSLIATTNHQGAVTGRYSYDPFGKRREITGSYDPFGNVVVDWGSASAAGGDRGYTGHEHLDDVGVIHMNGRIFDPLVGRFMQADPLIQSPDDLQNYDRYAYCFNAPTTCTDPSGYKSLKQHLRAIDTFARRPTTEHLHNVHRTMPAQAKIDRFLMDNEFAYTVVKVVVGYFTFGLASAGMDAYYNYERTGSANSSVKGFAVSAATSYAFHQVGVQTKGWESSAWGTVGQIAAHAAVGCASAELGGGNCRQGALAAGFGKAMTFVGDFHNSSDPWVRYGVGTAWAAMSGGVGAVLGGGKFLNGAETAAFGYLFNALTQAQRARLIAAGGLLGGTAGAVAAGGCTAGTGGVCALGTPTLVAGGVALGAAAGDALATAVDKVTEAIHGNSWLNPTPTTVYQLLSNVDNSVMKYGITNEANPMERYTQSFYQAANVRMDVITTYESRVPARMLEIMLCTSYTAANGKLPPMSGRC
jgi:RHS repeat-associated protein